MERDEQERIALDQPAFARLLGFRLISAEPDEVVAEMAVTPELANRNGVMHGGAIMSLADNIGGTATMINLPAGKTTTTLESKTNFLRPIRIGDVATARCVPLHKGAHDDGLADDDQPPRRQARRHRDPDAGDHRLDRLISRIGCARCLL